MIEGLDGGSVQQRETAMSQLSGALALDPGNPAGLELRRQLITHTPSTLPPEVEASRRTADRQARAGVARAAALRMGMWLALVPLIWAMGPLSQGLAAGVVGAVVGALGLSIWAGQRSELSSWGLALVMGSIGLALLGVVLIFGSFVVVPCLASTSLVMFAGHFKPRARAFTIAIGILIVLVPFLLEELAMLRPAYEFTLGQIHIVPRLIQFPPGLTKVVLVIATLSSLVMPGVLAGQLRDRLAQAEKKVFLMAWHLERLGTKG